MNLNTFTQYCIYICILLCVFNGVLWFVNGMGVFETVAGVPQDGSTAHSIFVGFTGTDVGLMFAVLTVGGIGAVAVAFLVHSTTPIAVYMLSAVFWTSYGNTIGVLNNILIPAELIVLVTLVMMFLWIGAIIGILSGAG